MKLSIAQLLAVATGVRAHGYLSQPMSRTGLNAQVRVRKLAGHSFRTWY
jgi:predicted carbohydrate-binding protein with CBM5 and CBM33 domain